MSNEEELFPREIVATFCMASVVAVAVAIFMPSPETAIEMEFLGTVVVMSFLVAFSVSLIPACLIFGPANLSEKGDDDNNNDDDNGGDGDGPSPGEGPVATRDRAFLLPYFSPPPPTIVEYFRDTKGGW